MALSPNFVAHGHVDIECGVFGTCIIGDHVLCNKYHLPCDRNSFVSTAETGVSPLGQCMKARDWGALFSGLCLVAGNVGLGCENSFVVTLLCCIVLGIAVRYRKHSAHVLMPVRYRSHVKSEFQTIRPAHVLGVQNS
eukprot:3059392-Amphidinium_carterae.4